MCFLGSGTALTSDMRVTWLTYVLTLNVNCLARLRSGATPLESFMVDVGGPLTLILRDVNSLIHGMLLGPGKTDHFAFSIALYFFICQIEEIFTTSSGEMFWNVDLTTCS